jgi:SAM-dependent methyltransferase
VAHENLLGLLRCSHCGSPLGVERREPASGPEIEFGVLACLCYRYPIVLGIPVLRQSSPPNHNVDPIVRSLDEGNRAAAVRELLRDAAGEVPYTFSSRVARKIRKIMRRPDPASLPAPEEGIRKDETLRDALARLRPAAYGDYLYFRHGNPSLLAALPVVAAIASLVEGDAARSGDAERPWTLDLGCGTGHTPFALSAWSSRARVVAADIDYVNLLIAKHFFVPGAQFVCFDAEKGLPFADGTFRAMFSLDCVHYIRGKLLLGRELRRIGRPDAVFAISHLHNAAAVNPNPGIPLPAHGYEAVFAPLGGAVHAEADLLRGFLDSGRLQVDKAAEGAALQSAAAFTYLAFGAEAPAVAARALDEFMKARPQSLSLNNLYQRSAAEELRMQWPSEALKSECYAEYQPLGETVRVRRDVLDSILDRRLEQLPADELTALIRSFVLVPQPRC